MFDEILKLSSVFKKFAVPFEASEFENLHDKYYKDNLKKDVLVYHGTSSKKLADIIEHGSFDPKISFENKVHDNASKGIFVTNKDEGFTSAEMYANNASVVDDKGDGSNPVVLELSIPIQWIEQDPDDTRFDEKGQMNEWGKTQGMVSRSIPIRRIKRVWMQGPEVGNVAPSGRDGIFEKGKTEFMPIGKLLDKIKKSIENGADLPEEYHKMVNVRPKGLSKSEPTIETEQMIAKGFENIYHTYYEFDNNIYEKALKFILNSGLNNPDLLGSFLRQQGKSINDIPYREQPRWRESIVSYLKRTRNWF